MSADLGMKIIDLTSISPVSREFLRGLRGINQWDISARLVHMLPHEFQVPISNFLFSYDCATSRTVTRSIKIESLLRYNEKFNALYIPF